MAYRFYALTDRTLTAARCQASFSLLEAACLVCDFEPNVERVSQQEDGGSVLIEALHGIHYLNFMPLPPCVENVLIDLCLFVQMEIPDAPALPAGFHSDEAGDEAELSREDRIRQALWRGFSDEARRTRVSRDTLIAWISQPKNTPLRKLARFLAQEQAEREEQTGQDARRRQRPESQESPSVESLPIHEQEKLLPLIALLALRLANDNPRYYLHGNEVSVNAILERSMPLIQMDGKRAPEGLSKRTLAKILPRAIEAGLPTDLKVEELAARIALGLFELIARSPEPPDDRSRDGKAN